MGKKIILYKMIPGDPTIKEVRNREKFYGYTECKPLYLDESYKKLYNAIILDKGIMSSDKFNESTVSEKFLKDTLTIWENLGIKLQEVDMIKESENLKDGEFVVNQNFLDSIQTVHPFELPIEFVGIPKINKLDGEIGFIEVNVSDDSDRNTVLCTKVFLVPVNNELTACTYNHEITHSQYGGYTSILDTETLPIFIEEVFASKIDSSCETLKTLRYNRLLHFAVLIYKLATIKNIAFISKVESDTYIRSMLQGIKLANTYLFGTPGVQKEMMNYVNQIFSENLSAIDMLKKFECDWPNVSKDINVLKRIK